MGRVALRYAKAIFELAQSENNIDKVTSDFILLKETLDNSHDLKLFLTSPIIDLSKKESILIEIFSGKISILTENFLKLLSKKGRSNELPNVIISYQSLLDDKNNTINAVITTAFDMSDSQKLDVVNKLNIIIGKSIRATYKIDEKIIGGFQAKFGDKLIDASIVSHLNKFRQVFIN